MADMVEIFLALRNVSGFVAGAREAETAMAGVGETSLVAGKKASVGWKGVAKWAAGAGIAYGAFKFMSSAVKGTNDLAKSTLTLTRSTNMDAATASEWVGLTKERGITVSQFQVGLVKLSKTMEIARTGTSKQATTIAALRKQIDEVAAAGGKKAPAQIAKLSNAIVKAEAAGGKARATLAALGIPLSELQKGDTEATLLKVSTAMRNMRNPAERLTLATTLFGKSGRKLLPVLMQGADGVRKLLDEQKKAGNYLTSKQLKDQQKLIAQQRALSKTFDGLRVQMGVAFLPIIISVGRALVKLADIARPLTSRAKLLKLVIAGTVLALIALKVWATASAAAAGEITMATKAWTAAQWLLNKAFIENPIGIVIVLIAALVVGIYEAYKHVKWFHNAVDAMWHGLLVGAQYVWNWVSKNWPLLLGILTGPFGIAALLIVRHFDQIKTFVLGVVDTIKQALAGLITYLQHLPSKLAHGATGILKGAVKSIPGAGFLAGKLAGGGVAGMTGTYLVGERGPEFVSLPRGAGVTPIVANAVAGGGPGSPFVIEVPVYLDGREIARSSARVTADRLARR